LHDESDRRDYAKDFEPHLHLCPACPTKELIAFLLPP
jgi:hypothetical protein